MQLRLPSRTTLRNFIHPAWILNLETGSVKIRSYNHIRSSWGSLPGDCRQLHGACRFVVCFLLFSACSSLLNTVDVHVVMSIICHFTSDIWKKINVAISNICYPEKSNAYLPNCSFNFSSELRHQKDQHTIKPAKRGKCISYVTTLSFNKLAMQQSGHEKTCHKTLIRFW